MPKKPKQPRPLTSPSPYDSTVHYDSAGSAVNGEVAILAGAGKDITEADLHSGVSPAVVGSLVDFEDESGRSVAERYPKGWQKEQQKAAELRRRPPRTPSGRAAYRHHPDGLDAYEIDSESGCWVWLGALKGATEIPTFQLKSARRLLWLRERGVEEAPARFLHASCGNRRCVSPDHAVWSTSSRLVQVC